MMARKFVLWFVIISSYSSVRAQDMTDWLDPPFKEPLNKIQNLTFWTLSKNPIFLSMGLNEEEEAPVELAVLNVDSGITPQLSSTMGSDISLFKIEPTNEGYVLSILEKMDYESPQTKTSYGIEILTTNNFASIRLDIINIKDNTPYFQVDNPVCKIQENCINACNFFCKIVAGSLDGNLTDIDFNVLEGSQISEEFAINPLFAIKTIGSSTDNTVDIGFTLLQELDFETKSFYSLVLQADDGVNIGTIVYLVQVIDMPDMPPTFTMSTTVYQAVEEQNHTIQYTAIDGDQGINANISYRLIFSDEGDVEYFTIDENSGLLYIEAIDRDTLNKENDMFTLTVQAYETENETSSTNILLTVIVLDINDNIPEITPDNIEINLDEGSNRLELGETIQIRDPDLAINGTFSIQLRDDTQFGNGENWNSAFLLIPSTGYQNTQVSISIVDPSKLDFEDENWRDIYLQIVATEAADSAQESSIDFVIHLQDINDESPVFSQGAYELPDIPEDIAKDTHLILCDATDKDFNGTDKIRYSLLPASNQALRVDSETGDVYVAIDNAFNYQQQTDIFVQILAEDSNTPPHQTYAPLSIKLKSVNRNAPTITVPQLSTQPSILENSTAHDEVMVITTTDVDETAELDFSIDWENSYATKFGARISNESWYTDCLSIETELNNGDPADIMGTIRVGDIDVGNGRIFNWTVFDMVYLTIVVTDKMTDTGYDDNKIRTAIVTILIEDVNDNPPYFTRTDSYSSISIQENTDPGSTAAIISASDPDGPNNNDIVFSISLTALSDSGLSLDGSYLQVDETSGAITTGSSIIDCELFQWMEYTLTASDGVFESTTTMRVNVIDQNDEFPQPDAIPSDITLREESPTGTHVYKIHATDADYSEQFHTCYYSINYDVTNRDYINYFNLNFSTGDLTVNLQNENNGLDMARVDKTFTFSITVRDTFDGQLANVNYTTLVVTLTDINNHDPTLPDPMDVQLRCHELFEKDEVIFNGLATNDLDEEEINKKVTFSILSITCTNPKGKETPEDLFTIRSEDNITGIISAGMDLKGYWGEYEITIFAEDWGNDPYSRNDTKTYTLTVDGFNENAPQIIYPDGSLIKVVLDQQVTGKSILDDNRKPVPNFEAHDPDQGINGTVKFQITGDDFSKEYLEICNEVESQNSAQLCLAKEFVTNDQYVYTLDIQVCDLGSPAKCNETSLQLLIYPGDKSYPIYNSTFNYTFTENTTDPRQEIQLPEPFDPDKDLNEILGLEPDPIYYFLIDGNNDYSDHLEVVQASGLLRVKDVLDREKFDSYDIRVLASKSQKQEMNSRSILPVYITVEDIIDTPPVFLKDLYSGGIVVGDGRTKIILAVDSTDEDLDDQVTYSIVEGSMQVSDSSLNNYATVSSFSFVADSSNPGVRNQLQLNFNVEESLNLKGFFTFDIKANDLGNNSNTVVAKVYVVSKSDQVTFVFENTVDEVKERRNYVTDVFTRVLGYTANIDTITESVARAESNTSTTDVTTHFIDMSKNEPVPASTINVRLNQQSTVQQLQREFFVYNLTYQTYQGNNPSSGDDTDMAQVLQIVLIVVSVVLGTLVIILIIAFYLRTRGLNRQLDALTKTKFGSQDSGLNRADMVMPNTNRHAIEGSNPVWNEDISVNDIDRQSVGSGDSDLIGIEEQPQFASGRRESFNPIFGAGTNIEKIDENSGTNNYFEPKPVRVPTTEL